MKKKVNNDIVKDKCELLEKVKDILEENNVQVYTIYKIKDLFYLISEFIIITYSEKEKLVDLAFHVDTRADVAAYFTLLINNIEEIEELNIMEIFMKSQEGDILTGDECLVRHNIDMNKKIIDNYVEDQLETEYLKDNYVGKIC